MSKKILLTGATGLIGKQLCRKLINRGDEVSVFTRSASKAAKKLPREVKIFEWNYNKPDEWKDIPEGKNAVIHLAGENLFSQRWTEEFKTRIMESRRLSTLNLSRVLNSLKVKPQVFISASAIGIYGDTGNLEINESAPLADDFMAKVCKIWEANAALVQASGIRRVSLRTGVVLSTKEGALKQMLTPFKLFVGGPLGTGKQWFSWIHLSDVVDGYIFAVDNNELNGAVNLSSPNQVKMEEFAKTLGSVLNRPSYFNVPEFALKLIAGEAGEVVTYSQRIIPEKLIKCGFHFRFPHLNEALSDLINSKG